MKNKAGSSDNGILLGGGHKAAISGRILLKLRQKLCCRTKMNTSRPRLTEKEIFDITFDPNAAFDLGRNWIGSVRKPGDKIPHIANRARQNGIMAFS